VQTAIRKGLEHIGDLQAGGTFQPLHGSHCGQ
jgi:hypothetical protein